MSRKRKPKPAPQELEAEADAILANDHLNLIEMVKRNTELIEQIHHELRQPSNDPQYLASLSAVKAQRDKIAAKVVKIHVVPDPRGTWLGIEPQDLRNHGEVLDLARQIGEHLEAPIHRHDPE